MRLLQLLPSRLRAAFAVAFLLMPAEPSGARAEDAWPDDIVQETGDPAGPAYIEDVLERIKQAESGGRRFAKNPRSSALGPFQFINATFLDIARRNFASEIADLSRAEILYLRTDVEFATRAARAFALENRDFLEERGFETTPTSLQLAHFAGPAGAARVLGADPSTPVASLLSQAALNANPFLSGMTVQGLLDRLGRGFDAAVHRQRSADAKGCREKPKLRVRCSLKRPSCRKWVALHQRILDQRWARSAGRAEICTAKLDEAAKKAAGDLR